MWDLLSVLELLSLWCIFERDVLLQWEIWQGSPPSFSFWTFFCLLYCSAERSRTSGESPSPHSSMCLPSLSRADWLCARAACPETSKKQQVAWTAASPPHFTIFGFLRQWARDTSHWFKLTLSVAEARNSRMSKWHSFPFASSASTCVKIWTAVCHSKQLRYLLVICVEVV